MTPEILKKVDQYISDYDLLSQKTVLEVGSQNINGSPRSLFPTQEYLGTDMDKGEGVDKVINAHDINPSIGMFDIVLCLETLEHDLYFWKTLSNIKSVLNTGGYLVISTPTTGFPEHKFPRDYYRFMEDCYREVFFYGMEILSIDNVEDKYGCPGIVGIARKIH